MGSYVMFDPATGRGDILHVSEEMLPAQTEGGRLIPLEIDGNFRTYEVGDGGVRDSYDFDVIKRPLLERIDQAAGRRRRVISDEQRRIYERKEAEARSPRGPTPYLSAEAKLKGVTVAELAAKVIARADADLAADAAIEAQRTAAKDAAREATDLAGHAAAAILGGATA